MEEAQVRSMFSFFCRFFSALVRRGQDDRLWYGCEVRSWRVVQGALWYPSDQRQMKDRVFFRPLFAWDKNMLPSLLGVPDTCLP